MKSKFLQYCLMGLFLLSTFGITIWSWVLVDPNFTLVNHADWTQFRALAISIGYFQRQYSASMYIFLIVSLTTSSYLIVQRYKGAVLLPLIIIGIVAGLLSYPALSHDLFNYIFDARIVTYYHANPYIHRALDFPADHTLRFMHWVHRSYPYGPTYLLISLVPSFLGLGIFSVTFFLFKAMHVILFVIAGWLLSQINRKASLIFATSPLIIVEGLINSHNDFIALSIAIVGIFLLRKRKTLPALLVCIMSGFIKYISLPVLFLVIDERIFKIKGRHMRLIQYIVTLQPWRIALGCVLVLLGYLVIHQEIQPWYFLNLFIFLPFAPHVFEKCTIALTGLLLSYYPYVLGGEWGQGGDVGLKKGIILGGLLMNGLGLLIYYGLRRLQLKRF